VSQSQSTWSDNTSVPKTYFVVEFDSNRNVSDIVAMGQLCDSSTLSIGYDRNISGDPSCPCSSFTATAARVMAVLLSNVMISTGKSIEGHRTLSS
jgi:hypothetical protein